VRGGNGSLSKDIFGVHDDDLFGRLVSGTWGSRKYFLASFFRIEYQDKDSR
jgi:hypothetical protein